MTDAPTSISSHDSRTYHRVPGAPVRDLVGKNAFNTCAWCSRRSTSGDCHMFLVSLGAGTACNSDRDGFVIPVTPDDLPNVVARIAILRME